MSVRIRILVLLSLLAGTISGVLYFQFLRTQPARQSSFLFVRTNSLMIREDYRQAVVLNSASAIVVEKVVPPDANLYFAFGIPKEQWVADVEPFRFSIRIEGRNPHVLYQKELSPSARKEDRRWQDVRIDLSEFDKRQVRFQFRLEARKPKQIAYVTQGKLTAGKLENTKPNVLLITIDTLRQDHVSAYGYTLDTTPGLDAFAKHSTFFAKAYSSAPLTLPSITSLMTSTYFSQHHVANNASAFEGTLPTLAEILKRNGYSTAAFVSNAVLKPNRGLDVGFDLYNIYLPSLELNRRLPERNAQQLTDTALSWLKTHEKERFFLWLHYQDPHAPYTPPAPYSAMYLPSKPSNIILPIVPNATGEGGIPEYASLPGHFDPAYYVSQYDGEIRFADTGVRNVLDHLVQTGIANNTIIIVLSDHGESLGENDHYFAHGHNVTPELVEIPLLFSVPKKAAERRFYPVQNVDIAPTLLQLLNITVPGTFRGQALFRTDPQRKAITEQPNIRWAIYSAAGVYVYQRDGQETFQGKEPSLLPEFRTTIQNLISTNLYGGLVFAFAGGITQGASILSDQPFRRVYLFGGEETDRIEISKDVIQLKIESSSTDVDYVFVEPQPSASLTTEGFNLQNRLYQAVSSPFAMSNIESAGPFTAV